MTLPELSIRRHVLAIMLAGVLVLFGLISYERIGVDRFPYIEFPVVAVTTTLPGAHPEVVDTSITNVIETAVNSVPGIEHVQSSSSPGVSTVAITFNLDKNVDVAFNEVQAKVNQVLRLLPKDADPPVVAKVETNAQPIMWLALQGDRTEAELNQYAQNVIKKKLENIDGVGEVQLGGKRDRVIRVSLDPARMAALGIGANDVTDALNKEHLQLPGGFVVSGDTEYLLKIDLEAHNLDDLRNLIVLYRAGAAVRLSDIARVTDDMADRRQLARFNGTPTVGLGIVKIANTNTVAIVDHVKEKLAQEIIPELPPGMSITISSNDAVFINEMVGALKEHLLEGTLLASLVVLLFLRSIRSTLIIAIAIPVSLLGAIAVMYFAGFTFNALTLLALLLLIGVVVDDAIVVLENIHRHQSMNISAAANMGEVQVKSAQADGQSQNGDRHQSMNISAAANMGEAQVKSAQADGQSQNGDRHQSMNISATANMGEAQVKSAQADGQSQNGDRQREKIDPDPMSSAIRGSREVVFAVLAATLSLVAIFGPVMFLGGIVGKFFKSFAVVVTFGVLVSMFVSFTLTPMLCSRFLKVETHSSGFYRWLAHSFGRLEAFYRRLLNLSLRHRWKVVLLTVLVVLGSGYFFAQVGEAFVPEEDEGRFLVFVKTPLGSSIDYTDGRLKEVEKVLKSRSEVATYFTAIGLGQAGQVNQALAFVQMQPREQRSLKQYQLLALLRQELSRIPGVRAFAAPVPIVGGLRGEPLQFVIRGPNLQEVGRLSQELQKRLAALPDIGRLDLDLQLDLPQLDVKIDRERAQSLGLNARSIAETINLLAGGVNAAKYNDEPGDGERYDIRLKAADGAISGPDDLTRIYLRAGNGQMVRLDTVVQLNESLGAAVIGRLDLQYAANFYGTPSVPLGEAIQQVTQAAGSMLPPGYTVRFLGEAEEMGKTSQYMAFAFFMALVLLYMVLASQFNSFLQPAIIMVAQPLAVIGGVMGLWLMGNVLGVHSMTLNIYSMIGLVLLIGLVAKNSILLVDLTNQRRAQGMDIDGALRDACPVRMRPVLMTSFTVILALLPAAMGFGAGADTNGPLSVAVIGGMLSSTLLTLVVVPAVYSLAEHGVMRFTKYTKRIK